MSRNYHAVTAEFNALYNGNLALEDGKEELTLTFLDNYWEILPVERVLLKDELILPGDEGNPNFNRAEEKAAKAIQKHSIYIDGKEYNPQIDEAYILLGQARYFDERFIPALDAFNFVLNKYPTSNNINKAKVWKAKTNIRLENEEVALESLQKMLRYDDLDEEDLADASAIMAQAYINLDSLPEAIHYIKLAVEYTKNNEHKGRYAFIKGQIYNRLEQKDSANMAFDEVIALNRKSPRAYMINAHLEKAKNFDYSNEDRIVFLELLQDLEEDRENRPFLDKIYHQMGEYYLNSGEVDVAIEYYNYSIQTYLDDRRLQAKNYNTLAEINFDRAMYKTAGAYYDSTMTNMVELSRPWRRTKKKRENLDDVIKYEDIAALNDSILRITNMSEEQQVAFFTDYAMNLKNQAIQDSIANIVEQEKIANNEFYKKQSESKGDEEGGPFYFYNSSTVAFGKQEFRKVWGNRKLEDNWRRSSKLTTGLIEEELEVTSNEIISENILFLPETYLSRIPKDKGIIDSITNERNFAYYQLGLIYKEKFKEYELAIDRLQRLLAFNPEERLVLPAKYNLYKIYFLLENNIMANRYKDDIITNHPDSRYAEILLNPNAQLATDESSPEFKYTTLYRKFEEAKFQEVINTCDEYIVLYNGHDIVPKLEILKATALGRQNGFEAYKKALNFVALTYPNSEEGKRAQSIYSTVLPKIAVRDFSAGENSNSWKVVYAFNKADRVLADTLKSKLEGAILIRRYNDEMSASVDYYDSSTLFVIIHGLNTKLGAKGFAEALKEDKKTKIERPHFQISSENYKIIQIHKNLNDYLNLESPEEKNSNSQN